MALCFGWIDGIRKGLDERSFLQRYTPRRPTSRWSRVNRDHVARLVAAGRMTKHGLAAVEAAKADGRWDAAYAPIRAITRASVPRDLRAAIAENPRAEKAFARLNELELFALVFHVSSLKTASGRARKIETLVAKLARGDAITPSAPPRKPAARSR